MIKTLDLHNFKCFENQHFSFGKLTMLSGLNGMGKSTVLQALLLLRQSYRNGESFQQLPLLNGDLVQLGTQQDVLFDSPEDNLISISLSYDESTILQDQSGPHNAIFNYRVNDESNNLVLEASQESISFEQFRNTNLCTDEFIYLKAERIGPRSTFPLSNNSVEKHCQIGNQGEYASHFLNVRGRETIPNTKLALSTSRSTALQHQVEAWLGHVSPGLRIELTPHPTMDVVNLQYSFEMGRRVSNSYRATNVGFGITYALPIVVALLAATPGTLLLLENPEAHLHPRGQARLGELMAMAAAGGVQIIVETHSDHVLDGIRLAVHAGSIAPADVRLYYFGRIVSDGEVRSDVVSPQIDRNGRIDDWPEGFFDEMDHSLQILLAPAEGST